jgi:glycosyltransferase involved in cell wall biosynthesis
MKYKVCQISSAHKRYDARIFRKVAVLLSEEGFDSFFLICDNKPNEEKEGVHIVSNGFVAKNHFQRINLSWKKLKQPALDINADIYQIHDPELFSLGFFLKKKGKIVIFDCHEDYRYIAEKAYIPRLFRRIILSIYLKKEKKVCKYFDAVITVTPTVRDRLKPFSKRMEMITNYPVLVSTKPHLFIGEPSLCFGGNCGWRHELLLDVLNEMNPDIKYNFVTNLNDPALNLYKKHPAWDHVNLYGYMSFEELRSIYEKSWIGFAVFPYCAVVNNNEGTLGNTKIFEFMMEGLPVICSDHKIWKKIIEEEQCGIAVNPYNKEELKKAIITLLSNKDLLEKMSLNARRAAQEKYNWSTQKPILINLYKDLLEK